MLSIAGKFMNLFDQLQHHRQDTFAFTTAVWKQKIESKRVQKHFCVA